MIYIFEDKADDLTSLLFKAGYDKDTASKFIYAGGNGNLLKEAENQLCHAQEAEKVCVFLDMVPDNKELHKIYSNLRRLCRQYTYRLIVMPIVCAEYYLIKSLSNEPVMKSKVGVDICINKEVYFSSPLIETNDDKKFCKTFEKYCKLILLKNMENCAKHSRGENEENIMYGVYYTSDCICNRSMDNCVHKSLLDKALNFLQNYPYMPEESLLNREKLSDNEIVLIHKKLVDEFNDVIKKYRMADPVNAAKYKEIAYFV